MMTKLIGTETLFVASCLPTVFSGTPSTSALLFLRETWENLLSQGRHEEHTISLTTLHKSILSTAEEDFPYVKCLWLEAIHNLNTITFKMLILYGYQLGAY